MSEQVLQKGCFCHQILLLNIISYYSLSVVYYYNISVKCCTITWLIINSRSIAKTCFYLLWLDIRVFLISAYYAAQVQRSCKIILNVQDFFQLLMAVRESQWWWKRDTFPSKNWQLVVFPWCYQTKRDKIMKHDESEDYYK